MDRSCGKAAQHCVWAWASLAGVSPATPEWPLNTQDPRVPPALPTPRPGGSGDDSHMKGLTVLWMCLCCLRPEDVAKVFPQSGQACARAPTCWERMCRCRLLGSVNTWGDRCQPCAPRSLRSGGWTGPPSPLCPAPSLDGMGLRCGPEPLGGLGELPRLPQTLYPQQQLQRVLWPRSRVRRDSEADTHSQARRWGAGRGQVGLPRPCPPPGMGPAFLETRSPGGVGGGGSAHGHVTFTQFSHSKRLPLSWDIWWRMRLDFQLKALGHWSHLYSRSSVCTTMCCSKLPGEDGSRPARHSPRCAPHGDRSQAWRASVHPRSAQAPGREGRRWPSSKTTPWRSPAHTSWPLFWTVLTLKLTLGRKRRGSEASNTTVSLSVGAGPRKAEATPEWPQGACWPSWAAPSRHAHTTRWPGVQARVSSGTGRGGAGRGRAAHSCWAGPGPG